MEERIHRLLRDLGKTLSQVCSETSDVGLVMRRIRQEGFSLYLVIDRDKQGGPAAQVDLEQHPPAPAQEPNFRLSGSDVAFLNSVGIDPTRRVRRRKKTPLL